MWCLSKCLMKHRAQFWLPMGEKTHRDGCEFLEQLTEYSFALVSEVNSMLLNQKCKKPKLVFRVCAPFIRNGCILGVIISSPSACLRLIELQVERVSLIFSCKSFSQIKDSIQPSEESQVTEHYSYFPLAWAYRSAVCFRAVVML